MKLQFKLMSLALIVFASNVQSFNFSDAKSYFATNASEFKAGLTKENAKAFFTNKENGKTALKVAVPAAGVFALYKLNKDGKLENVKSWIKSHKKTVAALVTTGAAAGLVAYNREAILLLWSIFRR